MVDGILVKAVSFVAKSGTGKTTLLEKLIRELKLRGYSVGAYKAISHHFDIDYPGKDSYRLSSAGADMTMICSSEKMAFVQTPPASLDIQELLNRYFLDVDIVLVEGDKWGPLPKIEIFRQQKNDTLLCSKGGADGQFIAIASDCQLENLNVDLPVLDLNNSAQLADFIIDKIL